MRLQAQAIVILVRGSRRTLVSRAAIIRSSFVEPITLTLTQVCSISVEAMAVTSATFRVAWRWRFSTLSELKSVKI